MIRFAPGGTAVELPFYFDYACPWAYLGSHRAEAYFRDLGVRIDFRPVHLRRLVEAGVGKPPELGPRKRANATNDIRHWAEALGAELSPDARALYKSDTQLALRCALVAKDEGRLREFHHPAYRARWAQARDVSSEELLRELLRGAGLDAEAALARARSPELEARLTRDTEAAIGRGVFGVPTIFVGDEMFWGNDRFELVRFYVQKAAGRG
jgi:2-hydroxychromene-2-carboxylate isomerase